MGLKSLSSVIALARYQNAILMMRMNLEGQRRFPMILKTISRFTLSKALLMLMNTMYRFLLFTLHPAIIWLRVNAHRWCFCPLCSLTVIQGEQSPQDFIVFLVRYPQVTVLQHNEEICFDGCHTGFYFRSRMSFSWS